MYLPLHKLRIPAGNIRRAILVLVVGIASFMAAIVASLFGWSLIAYVAHMLSYLCIMLSVVFAVPWIMAGVALILAPFAIYLFFDTPDRRILYCWWFWVLAASCVVGAVGVFYIAGRRYPSRDSFP